MKTVAPSGLIASRYPTFVPFRQLLGREIGDPNTGNCGFGLPVGGAVRSNVVKVGAQEIGSAVYPYALVPAQFTTLKEVLK